MDDFDPDAYLAKRRASSPATFDPDAYLAKRAAQSKAEAAPPALPPGAIELPANLPTPNLSLKDQRGYVPEKRTRAVFPDIGQSMTGDELAAIQPDRETQQKAAFLGGSLQGATMGYADELAALAKTSPVHLALSPATAALSAHGDPEYVKERNENRSAFRTSREWDPKKYAEGELTGAAATMPLTASMGMGPTAAKPLLSMANTGRAALGGAVQAIGSSEAEDAGGLIRDATLGAGAGVAANTGLGLLGKGARAVGGYIANAPARAAAKADEALIDSITLGAPAGQRDALMGELGRDRPDILAMVRSNPEFEAAIRSGDKDRAVGILRQMQAAQAQEDAATVSGLQLTHGKVKAAPVISSLEEMQARAAANPSVESQAEAAALQKRIDATKAAWAPEVEPAWASNRKVAARPLVDALENYRDRLAANPSTESQALAAKIQKRIDAIKEKWIPAERPKEPEGNALLGALMEGADSGDKQRAGSHAEQFLNIAKQNKLGKVVSEPEKTLTKIDATLEMMDKRRDVAYGKVKQPIFIANLNGRLLEWRDQLVKEAASDADLGAVDSLMTRITRAHEGETTMGVKELRSLISRTQDSAFAGSYLDPAQAKAMQRKAAGVMKDVLDEHVERHGGTAAAKQIKQLNEQYSALITFRNAAERRAIAARMTAPPAPEMRTGWAPSEEAADLARTTEDPEAKRVLVEGLSKQLGAPTVPPGLGEVKIRDVRDMANSIKDPDVRRAVTGALYQQIGPEASHTLAGLDRQAELAQRLETPLVHTGTREASPPTTLRHHTGRIIEGIQSTGARGLTGAALAFAAMGYHGVSAATLAAAAAAKYGPEAGRLVERAASAMAFAARHGSGDAQLMALAKIAGVPADMVADLVAATAPRAAANAVTAGGGE